MKIFFSDITLETILLTKDYFETEYKKTVRLKYFEGGVEIICGDSESEGIFLDEMHDFIKRISILERSRTLKEIIIGRALYGLAENLN